MIVADTVATESVLKQTRGFHWDGVPEGRRTAAVPAAEPPLAPDLGVIAKFRGVFQGTGLNTIFRPQNFSVSPTPLPNPANGPDDNVLQLSLTEETLAFSPALGNIPNRGMVQGDAFLNGVPYLQTINDVNDPANPVGIHFEPGVWLAVPPTQVPAEDMSFVRMASIPHGTTIEAQGTGFTVPGGPRIDPVDITPFPIGGDQATNPIKFPSQSAGDANTFRLPQDLSSFVAAGTITQAILDDPNTVIRARAQAQTITSTDVVVIDTQAAPPLFGGGTADIAFLMGDAAVSAPNANAVRMSAIFWAETVAETITLPAAFPFQPVIVEGDSRAGAPVARFAVTTAEKITAPVSIDVTYTQIQYTQTVLLNFNGLTWPHVSVATLVPNDPIPVSI